MDNSCFESPSDRRNPRKDEKPGNRIVYSRRPDPAGFFLPVRVLSRMFRRRFLEELTHAHRRASCVLW
jgi:hypothetical protein